MQQNDYYFNKLTLMQNFNQQIENDLKDAHHCISDQAQTVNQLTQHNQKLANEIEKLNTINDDAKR